ncbi:MAG: GAF domain-containing protein, partial [Chloroflexia bacterium]|nr:GAF domain-containing protein [Chloroflexia bacterium]
AELDVDALCELIYHEVGNVLDTSSFHLGIFEPDSDRYTLKVRIQDNQRLAALTVDLPSGDGLIGWMRQTGRPLLISDFVTEMDRLPARPRYQSSNPPRSGIYVPLISGDQVIGSISVQSLRVHAFNADDLRRLSQIADQAAVAIAKARTFHEARERAVQLQAIQEVSAHLSVLLEPDELLPEVLRLIREHFGYHPVHCITIADDGTLQFRATTTDHDAAEFMRDLVAESGTGIIAHVARTGQMLLVNDVRNDIHYVEDDPHTRSELAVPIRFGERLIGVLDVQSSEVWRFHQTDAFVMQTLADQIALALERARAFSAQREEAWRLNVLLQAAEELSRPTALGDLLTMAVRLPLRLLDCRRCVYLAWDRHRGIYTAAAAAGLSPLEEDALIGVQFAESLFAVPHHPTHNVMLRELPLEHDTAMQPFRSRHVLMLIARGRSSTPGILVADYDIPERTFGER